MSRLVLLVGALAMIAPTAGCGDDAQETSPFENTYNTTLHTRNNDGCSEEGNPATDGDLFFRLADVGGSLNYYKCTDAEACEDAINLSKGFTEQVGDSWRKIDITHDEMRFEGDDNRFGCEVTLTERTAELDGRDLRIEQRTYEGQTEREGDQDCTNDLVMANRDALTCQTYEVVTAVTAD